MLACCLQRLIGLASYKRMRIAIECQDEFSKGQYNSTLAGLKRKNGGSWVGIGVAYSQCACRPRHLKHIMCGDAIATDNPAAKNKMKDWEFIPELSSWSGGKKPRMIAKSEPRPPMMQVVHRPNLPPGMRNLPEWFGCFCLSLKAARNIITYMQRYIWMVRTLIMK